MAASVIPLRHGPSRKHKPRRQPDILTRMREQARILRATGTWGPQTADLKYLVQLAKGAPTKRGRPRPVFFEGLYWPVRETVVATSVCDPVTHEPLAGAWTL